MGLNLMFWRAQRADVGGDNTPVEVDEDNPLPVRAMGPAADLPAVVDLGGGSFRDYSGTIAAASTSQVVRAADPAARYFFFQVPTGGTKCWLDYGVPAVGASPSIEVLPGDSLELSAYQCTQQINVFCTAQGAAYTAKAG